MSNYAFVGKLLLLLIIFSSCSPARSTSEELYNRTVPNTKPNTYSLGYCLNPENDGGKSKVFQFVVEQEEVSQLIIREGDDSNPAFFNVNGIRFYEDIYGEKELLDPKGKGWRDGMILKKGPSSILFDIANNHGWSAKFWLRAMPDGDVIQIRQNQIVNPYHANFYDCYFHNLKILFTIQGS